MVRITVDLIRKRSEHNEGVISTLEELSLHQQDIEKIEFLDKWCRDLRILYLQSNLIAKLENLNRLKKLEYLNVALNNIERIENLEGCESLTKLDFTVNFIGELTSIESLKELQFLREMFLTGNPCCDYEGYREFVIATLPQLTSLDGKEIEKSERIKALQVLHEIRPLILMQQKKYHQKREKEKLEESSGGQKSFSQDNDDDTLEEKSVDDTAAEENDDQKFWEEKVPYTPESRLKVHEHMQAQRRKQEEKSQPKSKPERKLQADDGRMLNLNEPKIDFTLTDSEDGNAVLLDLAVFRFLDTSLCDVDVQPTYVRVSIKGKIFQLVLNEEVQPEQSSARRSQTTGHLLITMPKVKQVIRPTKAAERVKPKASSKTVEENRSQTLEVDPLSSKCVDLMVGNNRSDDVNSNSLLTVSSPWRLTVKERANSADFVDDSNVPDLI